MSGMTVLLEIVTLVWEWRVLFFIPVSSGKLSGIAITLFVSNCP